MDSAQNESRFLIKETRGGLKFTGMFVISFIHMYIYCTITFIHCIVKAFVELVR